jgi:membrane protease YdiL (CAAX protease family)
MTIPHPTTEVESVDEPRSEIRLLDVGAVFFFSMVTSAVGFAIGTAIGGSGSYAETCAGLIGLWLGLIPGTMVICKIRETGSLVRDLGLRFKFPSDLTGVAVGIACQFVLLPLIYVVVQLFVSRDLTKDLEAPAKDLTNNAHGIGFYFLAVLLIVGAPVVEEIYYRGMLLRSLKRYVPPVPAILTTGIVFGIVHFDWVTLPGLAAFGVVLAWLSHRSGRLGPNILAHAAFNMVTVIALWHG